MDSASKSLNPNKRLKEEFVSNLNGSSMLEIAALSTIIPVLFLLRHSIRFDRKAENSGKKDDDVIVSKQSWWTYLASLTLDFVVIVVPSVLVLTVLAEWVYIIAIMLMMLIFCIAAKRSFSSISYSGGSVSLRTSISSFRVLVMVVTCLCILAVDFRLFPRRYAKTENYGTSVMDLGVGSFVLANALVSRQARGVSSVNWKALVRSSIPLLVLGFGRLLSTRSVDYQVHVGEYGVHWNFFFTLAAVSMITSIVNIPARYSGFLGLLILLGYQCCLLLGLNVHLLSDERGTDIMSKNKEGIFSIFGYWGIYLVGVQLGYSLFFGSHFPSIIRSSKLATVKVLFLSFMFWLMTVLLDSHVERVSRRTCNLAYVTLVMAQNLQGLGILMLSDYFAGNKISTLEEAINRNLLFTFLLANILTGLVNIYVETLFVSSLTAVLILVLYAYSFCVIPGIADFYGLQLKFW